MVFSATLLSRFLFAFLPLFLDSATVEQAGESAMTPPLSFFFFFLPGEIGGLEIVRGR